MRAHDLVIKGATVVSERHCEVSDVAISDGRISQVGGAPSGRNTIEAAGLVVTPGGIDMHVHFTQLEGLDVPARPDDFSTGSQAAVSGGITTVGNMTHQKADRGLIGAMREVEKRAEAESLIDFVLHPVLRDPSPSAISELDDLVRAGFGTLKIFMVFEDFYKHQEDYEAAIREAASLDMLILLHAENWPMIQERQRELTAQGRIDSRFYPSSRPVGSEVVAVEHAVSISLTSGARILIVHLSSAAALDKASAAREQGVSVFVETRPLYLFLTESVFKGRSPELFVGNPPPRSHEDKERLWSGLQSGEVDVVSSDHAPWTMKQKGLFADDLRQVLPGVAELDTMLPMLFSEGVVKGRLTLPQFVRVSSTAAARLFRLYPSKGSIRIGADADLTIWDPTKQWVVDSAKLQSATDYSPYDGWHVTGAAAFTLSRGEILKDPSGVAVESGRGRRLNTSEWTGFGR